MANYSDIFFYSVILSGAGVYTFYPDAGLFSIAVWLLISILFIMLFGSLYYSFDDSN